MTILLTFSTARVLLAGDAEKKSEGHTKLSFRDLLNEGASEVEMALGQVRAPHASTSVCAHHQAARKKHTFSGSKFARPYICHLISLR